MSKFLDLKNNSLFKNFCIINELIENNYVINHIRLYDRDNKDYLNLKHNDKIDTKETTLKAQFLKDFKTKKYIIKYFNVYNIKINEEVYNNKKEFKKIFLNYAKYKLLPYTINRFRKYKEINSNFDFSKVLTYHKQKISKKYLSKDFKSNELDLKIEVYKWLLNKNKENIIIPEYSIKNKRADFISLNKNKIETTIIEIKSELDNLNRLDEQLKIYSIFATKIYLALDIKKYNYIIKKNIYIEDYIGILIYDYNNKNKLILLKEAKINLKQDKYYFKNILSYEDINNSFKGIKNQTKYSKYEKEELINKYIDKDLYNKYSYDILINRHEIESDKRKELFYNNKIEQAISSSKNIGINRFDTKGKKLILLSDYFSKEDLTKILNNY